MSSVKDEHEMAAPKRPRLILIDAARGVAILAMIIYHFTWDLAFTRVISLDITGELGWIVFQRAIVSSFLFLTGVSLVLAHGNGVRWPAFWRRFAMVGGAALLVTIGTYAFSPDTFVYFGILHAIALFGLVGLLFLKAPLILVGTMAVAIILLPLFVESAVFSDRILSWIGLWDVPPPSEDLVPFLPWFGVVLLGIAFARWAKENGVFERLAPVGESNPLARGLARAGRWSLVIYLVHQPIMLGALMLLTSTTTISEHGRAADFVYSCEASCNEVGNEAGYCTRYCACALEEVATRDLWQMLESPQRSEAEESVLQGLVDQCAIRVTEEDQALQQTPQI